MCTLFLSWLLVTGSAVAGPAEPPAGAEILQDLMAHEDELMALIEKNEPEHHRRLLRLREADPPAYLFALLRVAKMVERAQADPSFAERAASIRDRERRLRELAKGFEALSKSEQKARRAELETVAGELMDLKQEERRARLEEMRARIAEFELDIEGRERDRARIIDTYVDQLVQAPVDL